MSRENRRDANITDGILTVLTGGTWLIFGGSCLTDKYYENKYRSGSGGKSPSSKREREPVLLTKITVPYIQAMKFKTSNDTAFLSLDERDVIRMLDQYDLPEIEERYEHSFERTKKVAVQECFQIVQKRGYNHEFYESRENWLSEQGFFCKLRSGFGGCHPSSLAELGAKAQLRTIPDSWQTRDTATLAMGIAIDACKGSSGTTESEIAALCNDSLQSDTCRAPFTHEAFQASSTASFLELWFKPDASHVSGRYFVYKDEQVSKTSYEVRERFVDTKEAAIENLKYELAEIRIGPMELIRQADGSYVDTLPAWRIRQLENASTAPADFNKVELVYRNIETGELAPLKSLTHSETFSHTFKKRVLKFAR